MGVLRIVACIGKLYQLWNSGRKLNDNGDDSFLACRDPLLSPDLSLYRALCLILIPPLRKLCRHNGRERDAYFSTISVVVMYRLVRLYPVTTSFVSSETYVRSCRDIFNTNKKTKLKNFDVSTTSTIISRRVFDVISDNKTFDIAKQYCSLSDFKHLCTYITIIILFIKII